MLAPVVIFAFNRPEALKRLVKSLTANLLFEETEKFVFVDGPRNENDQKKIDEVVGIAHTITQHVIVSITNKGLGSSIITGISSIFKKYEKAIILEDDLICTPNFLSYMNQTLDFYEKDERIISVCGYGLKIKRPIGYVGDVYLSGRSSSWGWATWKNRWEEIDWEMKDWKEFSSDSRKIKAFNKNGSDMFSMLKDCMEGKNHSWAIRFCYNQFKLGKYAVCPFLSKIDNEGFGEEATNCKQQYSRFKVDLDKSGCTEFLFDPHVSPNKIIEQECYHYHSIVMRIYSKIRNIFRL